MLTSLNINNFQSCKSVVIQNLGSINVIFGMNNSGKSSILKAMNLPVQPYLTRGAVEWGKEDSVTPYLANYNETVSGKNSHNNIEISYKMKSSRFSQGISKVSTMEEYINHNFDEVIVCFKIDKDNRIEEFLLDKNRNTIYEKTSGGVFGFNGKRLAWGGNGSGLNWDFNPPDGAFQQLKDEVVNFFRGLYLLTVSRKPQDWRIAPRKWDRIGIHGENVVSLLNWLKNSDEILYSNICESISMISPNIGFTNGPMDEDGLVSITHQASDDSLKVNTLLSGTGINQAIPIIVQLLYAKKNDVIMIEEPEISLYPSAQEILVNIMVDEAMKGKQIILTTHSDTINMSLWKAVKDKGLSKNYVKCYHCTKEKDSTIVKTATLEQSLDILFSPSDFKTN